MATIVTLTGFEAGDLSEITAVTGTVTSQSSVVRSGAYAIRTQNTGAATGFAQITCAATIKVLRFYFRLGALPNGAVRFLDIGPCRLAFTASNTVELQNTAPAVLGTTANALIIGVWYRFEIKVQDVGDAGGRLATASIDGVQFATGSTSTATNTSLRLGKNSTEVVDGDFYYDDVVVSNTLADYPIGPGSIIARQPKTGGTPTYDAWAKSSGTDAAVMWDDTPFSATNACNSNSTLSSVAQTSPIDFSVTQTGHGTETITGAATINAAQVAVVAKTSLTTSGGSTGSIRRRTSGVDTDTLLALTTADIYYKSGIWIPTVAELAALEAGFLKGTSTVARLQTVEDVWVMVDYIPSAVVPITDFQPFTRPFPFLPGSMRRR